MQVLGRLRLALWNDDERRLRAPWRLLAGALVFAIALVAAGIVVGVTALALGIDPAFLDSFAGFTGFSVLAAIAVIGGLVVLARVVDRRRVGDYGLRIDRAWWTDLAFGLALGAALQTAIVLVGLAVGWYRLTGTLVAEGSVATTMAGVLVLFLAVGVYEEVLARGWLLTTVAEGTRFAGERVAVGIAVAVSSASFGLLHLPNPGATLRSATIISLAGVLLALGYVLTGELAIPVGLHVTWNFFQGGVYGFGVSGLEIPATVFVVEPVGPAWATGGAFGPEAGLLGAGAIGLGAAAICWWVRRRAGTLAINHRVTTPELRGERR